MAQQRTATPTIPQLDARIDGSRARDKVAAPDATRDPLYRAPPAGTDLTRNWIMSLLAAALVVAVLGFGISLVYPMLFRT
jgi:hypothetical protein